jgi:hypothetical protein
MPNLTIWILMDHGTGGRVIIDNPDGTRPKIRCGSIPTLRGRDFRCIHGDG